jgi:hypothetical protein
MINPTTSAAKPNAAINAATPTSGTGCLVRDGDGAYHADAACQWHLVTRTDRDGNLVLFSYHDEGNLPAGAPRPSSASQNDTVLGPGGCQYHEVTTPSGAYHSDCHAHN